MENDRFLFRKISFGIQIFVAGGFSTIMVVVSLEEVLPRAAVSTDCCGDTATGHFRAYSLILSRQKTSTEGDGSIFVGVQVGGRKKLSAEKTSG